MSLCPCVLGCGSALLVMEVSVADRLSISNAVCGVMLLGRVKMRAKSKGKDVRDDAREPEWPLGRIWKDGARVDRAGSTPAPPSREENSVPSNQITVLLVTTRHFGLEPPSRSLAPLGWRYYWVFLSISHLLLPPHD